MVIPLYGNYSRLQELPRLQKLLATYLRDDPGMTQGNPFHILAKSLDVLRPDRRAVSMGTLANIHSLLPGRLQRWISFTAKDIVRLIDAKHPQHLSNVSWRRYSGDLRRILFVLLGMMMFGVRDAEGVEDVS